MKGNQKKNSTKLFFSKINFIYSICLNAVQPHFYLLNVKTLFKGFNKYNVEIRVITELLNET